jgi:hypothetical protein
MKIDICREDFTDKSTVGKMFVDGVFECFTLEDVVRNGPKVYGATAIPVGTYSVIIDFSGHFQKELPRILDVPGFEGIRIHCGNTDKDTEGCILLGRTREEDFVGESKLAFASFFPKLRAVGEATITVS